VENGIVDSAAFGLQVATQSLDHFASIFGPYPYSRLVVVQSDFPDGMEFSGLVFVGGEYFRGFNGPQSYLMLITAHEVAHQWWYQQVGNDQALHPWLDEALATYSEYLFIEAQFPGLTQWWWDFRVNTYSPEGFVDSSVYEFSSRREYINAIYLRGVRMLGDLRAILGDAPFMGWLRRYYNTAAGGISSPAAFWSVLTPEQYAATEAIRQRYLRNPQIITANPGQ
jgi:aminopeptidase N